MSKTFGTAINCMDGRTQVPIIEWVRKNYSVDYVDMITEAGPIGRLALDESNCSVIESIKSRSTISVKSHYSDIIAVIGHEGCLGNPVPKEQQIDQIKESVEVVKKWGLTQNVVGLWIEDKVVEKIG